MKDSDRRIVVGQIIANFLYDSAYLESDQHLFLNFKHLQDTIRVSTGIETERDKIRKDVLIVLCGEQ